MSVELVAAKSSDSTLLERFPVVIGPAAGSVQVNAAVPGGCHCLVSLVDSQLVVWDLGTAGGTFVNGARVTKAALKPGDTLKLGELEFKVNERSHSGRYLHGVRS